MIYNFEPWDDWHETTLDNAKAIGAIMGWEIEDIAFSGFCSQGDGASFTGHMGYAKNCVKAMREYAPLDTELHSIARQWQEFQKSCFYGYRAQIARKHHRYSHENTVYINSGEIVSSNGYRDATEAQDDTAITIARDFMGWIYRTLECEYEYQRAWEASRRWQDLAEDAARAKQAARDLIRDIRRAPCGWSDGIHRALRANVKGHLSDWRDALAMRGGIADDFYYSSEGETYSIEQFAAENL